ncbi:glycosyltransferase, partial [Candidatus Sumerlaeota bacterium]|nr:glycosyltransferase [Candidatus Sumerlaeota bacterium]
MKRILVLTTEPLPFKGMSTTGAGLRAWGMAKGLAHSGLDVTAAMPMDVLSGKTIIDETFSPERNIFHRSELDVFVQKMKPDAIVFQHWGLMKELSGDYCPIALDLAGPHLLERYFWSGADKNEITSWDQTREIHLVEKLTALRRADFICCSGKYQRLYFLPFLSLAGFPMNNDSLPVIPFSVSPEIPDEKEMERDPERFVYGGLFLPWQNPQKPIQWLLECFDEIGKGRLSFFGGMHPALDVSRGRFDALLRKLESHPRVSMKGILSFDELVKEYRKASVALDLLERNPERELAFTTRTIVYLWCGLPVIYNNYSELSEYIDKSRAGWALDPEDENAFKKIVKEILSNKTNIKQKSRSALDLVRENFDWNQTIAPLAHFCLNPYIRKEKTGAILSFENRIRRMGELEEELEKTRSELLTIKGKLWYRLYKRSNIFKILFSPILFLITLILSLAFLLS